MLIQKLLSPEVNSDLVLWIRPFLCDRPQRAGLNARLSSDPVFIDEVTLNTGVPPGRVLCRIFFSIYANDNATFLF